jgi:preprotein translocase SecE subunit
MTYKYCRFFKFPGGTVADESSESAKPKRRLRTSNETVRERAAKTQASENKPKRKRGIVRKTFAPLRPVGRISRKIGRFVIPPYFRNSWRELRQVTWPKWKQSRQLTGAVIVFSIIFGVLIAIVDFGLDKVFKKVILKQ